MEVGQDDHVSTVGEVASVAQVRKVTFALLTSYDLANLATLSRLPYDPARKEHDPHAQGQVYQPGLRRNHEHQHRPECEQDHRAQRPVVHSEIPSMKCCLTHSDPLSYYSFSSRERRAHY
jgi:hypothetical protein